MIRAQRTDADLKLRERNMAEPPTFDIRSGVPIPRRGGRPGVFYPFEELQVGQCFVLPKTLQSNAWKKARAFMDAHPGWQFKGGTMPGEPDKWGASDIARELGITIETRQFGQGIRIWRTK